MKSQEHQPCINLERLLAVLGNFLVYGSLVAYGVAVWWLITMAIRMVFGR